MLRSVSLVSVTFKQTHPDAAHVMSSECRHEEWTNSSRVEAGPSLGFSAARRRQDNNYESRPLVQRNTTVTTRQSSPLRHISRVLLRRAVHSRNVSYHMSSKEHAEADKTRQGKAEGDPRRGALDVTTLGELRRARMVAGKLERKARHESQSRWGHATLLNEYLSLPSARVVLVKGHCTSTSGLRRRGCCFAEPGMLVGPVSACRRGQGRRAGSCIPVDEKRFNKAARCWAMGSACGRWCTAWMACCAWSARSFCCAASASLVRRSAG